MNIVYFLFLTPFVFISLNSNYLNKYKITLSFILVMLISIIIGFRSPGVDRDYIAYSQSYFSKSNSLAEELKGGLFTEKEVGIRVVASLVINYLKLNIASVFVFISILSVAIKYYAILLIYKKLYIYSIIVYLSNYFILHEMTQIRIGLASALFLLSLDDIINNNIKHYLIKIFIGCLFHYTALIFLPIYFIINRKLSLEQLIKYMIISMLVLSIIIAVVMYEISDTAYFDRISAYTSGHLSNGTINFLNPLVWFRIVLLLLLFWSNRRDRTKKLENIIVQMYLFGTGIFFLLFFMPVLALRLSQMFFAIDPIAIPFLIFTVFKRNEAAIITISTSVGILCANIYLIKLVNPFALISF